MAILRKLSLLGVVALLAGCSGSGNVAPGGGQAPGHTSSGKFLAKIVVPARAHRGSSGSRKMQYVSPSSEGLTIISYPQGSSTQNGEAVVDISASSSLCTTNPSSGVRTCTVYGPAVPGTNDIDFTDYDEAPVSGAIPSGAHVLSVASLIGFTIVANQANTATVYLEGQPYQFEFEPGVMSFPADGKSHTSTLTVDVEDADGNTIVTGANAPYDTPVMLTLTETNGSGITKISENSGTPGTTETFTTSNNTFAIVYDGGGSPGASNGSTYYALVTATSADALLPATMEVSPLYLAGSVPPSGTGQTFTAGYPASIGFTAAGQIVTLTLVQFTEPTSGTGYAVKSSTCGGSSGIANVTQNKPVGSPIFTVTAGTGSSGTCTVTLTDGVSTYPINVTLT
jgi:hypothetical protein